MIRVDNRRAVRRLALRSLRAARSRNLIAVAAIALTTALFCALFTIALTLVHTVEEETFRQVGTDAHGGLKNMTEAQMQELTADDRIVESGGRLMLGAAAGEAFRKDYGEVSYMDATYAAMSFCTPTTGALPAEGSPDTPGLACDTRMLELLGVEPSLGAPVALTFELGTNTGTPVLVTETFTLTGWWEYDPAVSASQAIVPRDYAESLLANYTRQGPTDVTGLWSVSLNLRSAARIEADLRAILADHGYQCDDPAGENYIGIGVNWGYLSTSFAESFDPITAFAVLFLLAVMVLTGYLVIYNIFQISVANDIRHYGLLKTIGTTPRQIRALVRWQALALSVGGIPVGLALGYALGAALAPSIQAILSYDRITISRSPWIFLLAAAFSLGTVLLSCARPGRLAGRVSPIEALRYTDAEAPRRKRAARAPRPVYRAAHKTKAPRRGPVGMAAANLRRTPRKTALAVASLALAVGLLQITCALALGFDLDKYLANYVLTDFVLADAGYFKHAGGGGDLTEADIAAVEATGLAEEIGVTTCWYSAECFVPEAMLRDFLGNFVAAETLDATIAAAARDENGGVEYRASLYGFDATALGRVELLEGDLSALAEPGRRAVAAVYELEDDGTLNTDDNFARVGDVLTLRYVSEWESYNAVTGQKVEDPDALDPSLVSQRPAAWQDIEYEVVACIAVPHPMSLRSYSGPQFALNASTLRADCGGEPLMLNACFDAAEGQQAALGEFLAAYTANGNPVLDYESRDQYASEFAQVRGMFLLLGGALSAVVALVGVLNFANAMLTSILSRRREFAVLQAVGMTDAQLNGMLIAEGLLYAALAGGLSLVLCLLGGAAVETLAGGALWFFTYRFSLLPLGVTLPFFAALGAALPPIALHAARKQTLVERLRVE